jgi:hypothetical protein
MQVQQGAGYNPFKIAARVVADRAADAQVQYQAPEVVLEQYAAAVAELEDPRRKKFVDDLFDAKDARYDGARRAFDDRNYQLVAFINAQMKSIATQFLTAEIGRLQAVVAPLEAAENAGNAVDLAQLTDLQVDLMRYQVELAAYGSPAEYDRKIKMNSVKYQRDAASPKSVDLAGADEFVASLRERQAEIVFYRDVEKHATDVAYMRKKDVDYRTKNASGAKLFAKLESAYRGYEAAFNRNRAADCANNKALQDMIRIIELAKEKRSIEEKFPGSLNAIRRAYHAYAADVNFTNDTKNESGCVPETYQKPEYVPPGERSMQSVKDFVIARMASLKTDAQKTNKVIAWLKAWAPSEAVDASDFQAQESVEDLKAQLAQCLSRERQLQGMAGTLDRTTDFGDSTLPVRKSRFFTHVPERANYSGGGKTHNYAVSACLAAVVLAASILQ